MRITSLEMLQEFVSIPSPTGLETAFAERLHRLLGQIFEYDHLELQEVAPGRHNVIMVRGTPRIMLTSHMDTVPTNIEPYMRNNSLMYGTGTCDAKGQIASQLSALVQAADQGLQDYGCFYVVGEEVDSIGAQTVIKHPLVRGDYVVNGEPSNNRFVSSSKGVVELLVRTVGTERHSSVKPMDSAIHKLISSVNRLLDVPPKGASINIGMLGGGTAANVSAASAQAVINLRIAKKSDVILETVRELLGDDALLEVRNVIEPFNFHLPEDYSRNTVHVSYCSDAPYYATNFKHVMMFGPGAITHAHSTREHVQTKQLLEASGILADLLLRLESHR